MEDETYIQIRLPYREEGLLAKIAIMLDAFDLEDGADIEIVHDGPKD